MTAKSLAEYRVASTDDVAVALAFLSEERRTWLSGANAPPIERLTMLASPRSVALVTPDANITWLCHPEPDSAAVFAHLLGGDERRRVPASVRSVRRCRCRSATSTAR